MRRPRLGCLTLTLAVIAFLTLVLTGVMNGAVFLAALTPVAEAEPAVATSQCEPLPAAAVASSSSSASLPSSSASPSPSSLPASPNGSTTAAAQLCVSVQAGQDSIKGGQTATWSITVSAQGGSVPAVTVSLSSTQPGTAATFTGACPSGSGTASCDLGDLATNLTPASYILGAQITVPASPAAGTLIMVATATSPAMTGSSAAGQGITILTPSTPTPTAAHSTPAPAHSTRTPEPAPTRQAPVYDPPTQPAADPVTTSEPALGALPAAPIAAATTVPAGNVASVLPVITPATAPAAPAAPGTVASTTPVANVQQVPEPASGSPQAGTFTLTIAMSARTAEVLGMVILALAVFLVGTRVLATQFARARTTTPRTRIPRPPRRQRPGRKERRAAREANWRRHLESERKALPPPAP